MFVPVWVFVAAALGAAILIVLLISRASSPRRDEMREAPRPTSKASPDMEARVTRISADPEVRAALAAGRKIDAIKLVRDKTGLGLKEAKDMVDSMR